MLAVRDGGGSVVAWVRRADTYVSSLRLALIDEGGAVRSAREIDVAADIRGVGLVRVAAGHALVYIRTAEGPDDRQIVLRTLDRDGAPGSPRTLADGDLDHPHLVASPEGLVVVFTNGDARLSLVTVGRDGSPDGPPRQVHDDPRRLAEVHATDVAHHRGRLWSAAHVSHCTIDRCIAPARAFVFTLAGDGSVGRPIELDSAYDLILGDAPAGLFATWSSGRRHDRLRLVELRCTGDGA